ncbi:MAG: hypothetical protein U9P90_00555, partial [Patescibacteria group bacterium]|nr:hypothetical protein [Patescibacteria group bacterium]
PECPECPEFFENHFPAEYVFVSMVKEDAEGNYVELPQSNGECVFAPTGNVSMENGINGYRYFYLHFLLTLTCFNNPSETIEEFYLLGEYSFDNDYLFMTGSDYGEFMWFRYEFNGEFLELLPQWEEEDGSRTVSIILERVGEPGECASSSLGRCYRDEDCTRNFASGCYQKSACFELGGKSWRRRNSDGTYGPCETS